MTKEVIIRLRDDLDKKLGQSVSSREFTIDGIEYETELSDANYNKLLKAVEPYVAVARPKKKVAKKKATKPKTDAAKIREWARETGRQYPARGSLPPELVEAYRVAHPPPEGSD